MRSARGCFCRCEEEDWGGTRGGWGSPVVTNSSSVLSAARDTMRTQATWQPHVGGHTVEAV